MQDEASLVSATEGVQTVIHLAAAKSDEQDSYETNVLGAENLIKACKKNQVSQIINISTQSAKIENKGTYADTKHKADQLFMQSGLNVTTLRPSVVYGDQTSGVFGSLVKFSKLPVIPVFGLKKWYCRPIHVDDLVKSFDIAIHHQKTHHKVYDVGGPTEIDFDQLIHKITNVFYKQPFILHIPAFVGYTAAVILSKVLPKPPITVSNILGSTQNTEMDVQTFFSDFEYTPIDLDEGFKKVFELKENGYYDIHLLYPYILSHSKNKKYTPTDEDRKRYITSLQTHELTPDDFSKSLYTYPILLGPLDALTRLFSPKSALQKKLYITSALIECHPVSADWLLPKDRSILGMLVISIKSILSTFCKWVFAILLLLIPGFYKKHVY